MAVSIFIQIADDCIARHDSGRRAPQVLAGAYHSAENEVREMKPGKKRDVAFRQALSAVVRTGFIQALRRNATIVVASKTNPSEQKHITLNEIADIMIRQYGLKRKPAYVDEKKKPHADPQRQVIYKLLKSNGIGFPERNFRRDFLKAHGPKLVKFLKATSDRFLADETPLSVNTLAVKVRKEFGIKDKKKGVKHDPLAGLIYVVCKTEKIWHGNPNRKATA